MRSSFTGLMAKPPVKTPVFSFARSVRSKSDLERTDLAKEKTGVFTGGFAINPVNDEKIPIWIADYVLMAYGTGAIMAVPAHDERDYEFARTFGLPIRRVIECGDLPCTGDGPLVNSGQFDGLNNREAYDEIVAWLDREGKGHPSVN